MSIEIREITDEQRDSILDLSEGHFVDLKAKEIRPSKLTQTISSFANTDGGELYIGIFEKDKVAEIREWNGFDNAEAANAHLQVFEALFPLGEDFTYTFLSNFNSHGLVLYVTINKTKSIVYSSDEIPYIRRGAQKLPVDTAEKLTRLERNKGITSFENELISIDLSEIWNSEIVIRFMLEVIPSSEPDNWLKKQRLIQGDKVTVTGVLLFSDLPQAILPKRSGIKVYRYKTSNAEGTRETLVGNPISIEGCAYDLIKDAVSKTQELIVNIQVLGTSGLEQVNYPIETLHEIITNAVLHRDYSVADDIHIRIFDNRVEIESPGRLPAHITVNNILDERFARNGNLVRVINKFPEPPNKDVGEGLNTAFAAMRRLKLKEPQITERLRRRKPL